jgi:hypothetical protein
MEAQDSSESRSLGSRAREASRRVTGPLASATSAVTGKGVEQRVAEYTETFTQVVLGLHEDLEIVSRRIGNLEATVAKLQDRPGRGDPQNTHKKGAYVVAIAALAVALVALGVSVWVAL